jgi:hypothetical protein
MSHSKREKRIWKGKKVIGDRDNNQLIIYRIKEYPATVL